MAQGWIEYKWRRKSDSVTGSNNNVEKLKFLLLYIGFI